MAERRFDLVHGHGYDGTWWAIAARETVRPRPPLVVTCHGWIETSLRLRATSALDRAANRVAAGMVVVSDELVPTALACASRATAFAVVPNGVRVDAAATVGADLRSRLGLSPDTTLVGAMGRLAPEKRHDVFIDACSLIHEQRPDLHFVLAGGGPLRDDLERRAARLGLSRRLHLVGVIDRPQHFLRQLDVVAQPSDVETTSRVVLESMAQKRPLVVTSVGGTPALVDDGVEGLLVPPGSPQAIADGVLRVLRDPDLRDRLGRAARRRVVNEFSLATMADGVHDVYQAVLGAPANRPQTWVRAKNRGQRVAQPVSTREVSNRHGAVLGARSGRDVR